jgi:NADH-quinone oxidoreductase subunit H
VLIALFIWVRGTTPRLRMDQLMDFAWKFMLPLALIILPDGRDLALCGTRLAGWLVTAPVVAIAYVLLGRALMGRRRIGKRTYRYAST